MARGKKKETLTPEERLQAALIPEREQPYKVPENWCWVKFGTVCKFENGYAFKSERFTKNQGIPVVRISNIVDNSIALDECVYTTEIDIDSKYIIHNGDLLIAMSGATTGKNGIYDSDKIAYLNQRVGNIKVIDQTVLDPFFRNFYISSAEQQILNSAYGGAQPNISSSKICDMSFPLPPLSEQQRIVDRIESLFSKLDEAKQKAQDALDSFETRKAAILHKAFTGELTAQWRKEHGIGMDSWERLKLGEIGTLERGRSQHRPRNDPRLFGGPYPFIQTGDVASANVYITEHHQTLSEFGMEQSRMFSAGTLCITIAANIGDVAILSYDCCFPDSVVGFIPNNRSISKFVYYMMSVLQKELEDNAPATAQKNINLKILNAVEMNIPPVIEQTEIIRMLDGLLAKEQQAKEAAAGVLEQIDLIKKAILARAFRGDLGTNDPSEESAVELLKQILSC